MANTDELRKKILKACEHHDMGITIAALGQAVAVMFAQIDNNAPHLSEQARKDLMKHIEPNYRKHS